MAASLGIAQTRQLDEEFVAAANAVFGVLELIGEDDCSERTREDLAIAREGAERCLAELGLERSDLLGAAEMNRGPAPPQAKVLHLRRPSDGAPRDSV